MRLGIDALMVTAPLDGAPALRTIARRLARLFLFYGAIAIIGGAGVFGVVVLWEAAGTGPVLLVMVALSTVATLLGIRVAMRGKSTADLPATSSASRSSTIVDAGRTAADGNATRLAELAERDAYQDDIIRDLKRKVEQSDRDLATVTEQLSVRRDEVHRLEMRVRTLARVLGTIEETSDAEAAPTKKKS